MKNTKFQALLELLKHSYSAKLYERMFKVSFNQSQWEDIKDSDAVRIVRCFGRFAPQIVFVGEYMAVDMICSISTYNLSVLLLQQSVEANESNLFLYE